MRSHLTNTITFPERPFFSLKKNSDQTGISSATATKITWEAESEPSQHFQIDLTNNRVYILRSGKYTFSVGFGTDRGSNSQWVRLYKNGVEEDSVRIYPGASPMECAGTFESVSIVAGDYVEMFYEQNTGADATIYSAGSTNYNAARFIGVLVSE